jgi:hypothetical protein
MGSSIGPGSNNQSISLSWNKGYNKIGIFLERTVYWQHTSPYLNRKFVREELKTFLNEE